MDRKRQYISSLLLVSIARIRYKTPLQPTEGYFLAWLGDKCGDNSPAYPSISSQFEGLAYQKAFGHNFYVWRALPSADGLGDFSQVTGLSSLGFLFSAFFLSYSYPLIVRPGLLGIILILAFCRCYPAMCLLSPLSYTRHPVDIKCLAGAWTPLRRGGSGLSTWSCIGCGLSGSDKLIGRFVPFSALTMVLGARAKGLYIITPKKYRHLAVMSVVHRPQAAAILRKQVVIVLHNITPAVSDKK